jgi:hypothetical protein
MKNETSNTKAETRSLRKRFKRVEQSRDSMKDKNREKGTTIKKLKDRHKELEESRDQWKAKYKQSEQENSDLAEKNVQLASLFNENEEHPSRSWYPLWIILICVRLILIASPLKTASNSLRIVFATASILKGYNTPAPTTIKRWVQKVGYYKLTLPKETADDWMVIIDASIQIGRKKCVLVIGCREADFPMNRALALKDLQILSLRIVSNVNADVITKILEEVALTVGRITAICSDRGSDMFRGIKNFQIKHPEARHVCDTAHRIANLLEETLENSKIWKQFRDLVTHSRRRMQNSSVAGYLPPSPRTKARYMNMDSLIKWAVDMLLIIDNPELFQSEVEELKKYVGWLINFREDIAYWNGIISIGLVARDLIRKEGMHINIVNSFEEAISNIKMGFRELQFASNSRWRFEQGSAKYILPAHRRIEY